MKHKFVSKIVFLSVLLALMFSAVGVVPAEAAGNFTHPEVARMALGLLPASELATLLNTYQGYVLAGSVFPDWGYGVEPHATTYGYYSDMAHLTQFSSVYLNYFKRTYSPPYSDEAKKSLAFLFGVISHQTADAPFHSSFLPYVYVNEIQIFGTPGEQDIEVGVDVFNMFDRGCWNSDPVYGCFYKWNWISWDIPVADIQAVYDELFTLGISVKSLTTSQLETGWNEYQTEATLLLSGETQMYTYYSGRLPNTHGFYYDYPYGGMTNMANLTAAKWQETWNALGATVYVKPIATGTEDCSSWENACTLQTALNLPYLGGSNEVWVMQGIYKPTANDTDRTATFQLKSGVMLYGGFAGDETLPTARHGGASILSGDIDKNDTNTDGNNIDETYADIIGNNSYHVVRGTANATLDGFVVTGGQANGSYPDNYGGGMFNWPNSNPTIANVTFSGNSADTGGGMSNNWYSSPTLTNVTFSGNSAFNGGGLNNETNSSPLLMNVTFSGNSALYGGGLYNNSSPTLKNVIIANSTGGDCYGWLDAASVNNLIESTGAYACDLSDGINGNIIGLDPLLGALGNYGSSTLTTPLLPGSLAINAGDDATCAASPVNNFDQRGVTRPQGAHCDIGAFESQGFTLAITGGNNQSVLLNAAFPIPLTVSVTANAALEPVNGGQVIFTPPASGASAALTGSPATISGGSTSVTATANGTIGSYNVTTSTRGAQDVSFSLTNKASPILTWANPADIAYGTPLSATQLNATADVPGTFTYTPAAGIYLSAGTHTLHVDFVPTNTANYANASKDVSITVLANTIFTDVPSNYWARDFIERLYFAGVTGGCSTNPLMYCPATTVTRDQMAVFLLRGEHGSTYTPPPATGTMFADVPQNYWAAAWIEQLANEGITGGCSNGNYCPTTPVTRDQMAVFLLRGKHGGSYTPPAATGTMFGDIPSAQWAAAWIEQLASEGITGGCGGGNYCPSTPVTRDQMAVFLVRAFNLP